MFRTTLLVLVNCIAALLAAAYVAEGYLRLQTKQENPAIEPAVRAGRPADRRSVRETIADFRARGIRAYPCCAGAEDFSGKSSILPLTMGANEFVVFCNESGTYLTYQSDEHGFHNPPGSWRQTPVEAVLLGDSFTQGNCVPDEAHFVQPIRNHYSSLVNLGIRGVGPLNEFAAFKEYALALQPRRILWVFYENDLDDLHTEKDNSRLMKYLGKNYRQSLLERQAEVDATVTSFLERRIATVEETEPRFAATGFLKLARLRTSLLGHRLRTPEEADYRLFRDILADVNATSRQWGGKLVLVYLPSWNHFLRGSEKDHPMLAEMHRRVLEVAGAEHIPVIDIDKVFFAQPDPRTLFFYPGSHYNETGYRIVGDTIVNALAEIDKN